MAGIKIINVLKDDSLAEILEVFRQAPAGEVIFVLPKNGKVFKKEDHFAAFASEAAGSGKTISVLAPNPQVAAMARAFQFNVMSAGKTPKPKAGKKAILASAPPPADDDIQDTSEDAFQASDVPVTSDESMGVTNPEEAGEATEPLEGFHVEDEQGQNVDKDNDGLPDEPTHGDIATNDEASLTVAKTAPVELDYLDAAWRDKVRAQGTDAAPTSGEQNAPWARLFKRPSLPSGRQLSRKLAGGILGASAVLLGTVIWVTTGSAEVVVTPVARDLDLRIMVQASDVVTAVDGTFNKIPGQLFEATRSATVEMPATGMRDVASKARGTLTVSNEYSSSPQTLVATTRFVTADGMVFRTLRTVAVPGSAVSEGTMIPGTVTVDVVADKPGAQYNVAAGGFTIAAFKERGDTERAQKITGVSTAAMSGGANGPSKVVTADDHEKALASAKEQVRSELRKAFDAQTAGMRILNEAEPTWEEPKATARADDAADTVSVTATATLRTMAFRPADLEKLLVDAILKKERLVVIPEQLDLSFDEVAFKPNIGTLAFAVTIKGPGYEPIDQDTLRAEIKGRGTAQIREYFRQQEGIEAATVSLSPFWVRSVPKKDSRVVIDVRYASPTPTP